MTHPFISLGDVIMSTDNELHSDNIHLDPKRKFLGGKMD